MKNVANSWLHALVLGSRSPSLHRTLSWRHAAITDIPSFNPVERNTPQAQQRRQGGTTTQPGKVASNDANTNPQATIAADIAYADYAKEYPVVNMGINSTSPQVAGDVIVAAAEAICGTAAATASEANHIEVYSDDATTACSATDVTIPTTPTHVDIHAPPENTTREETGRIGEAEKDRITTETPPKSTEAQNYPCAELPRISMHQPVMRTQRQFRTKTLTGDIIMKTRSYGNSQKITSSPRRSGNAEAILV